MSSLQSLCHHLVQAFLHIVSKQPLAHKVDRPCKMIKVNVLQLLLFL